MVNFLFQEENNNKASPQFSVAVPGKIQVQILPLLPIKQTLRVKWHNNNIWYTITIYKEKTYSLSDFWHQACKATNYFFIFVNQSWYEKHFLQILYFS